ncbi:disease resistance RPP13-like protein 4 [Solanum tuberosum]|nr:PREDICTED: disease resistance RPP13-like protein 4 [Solanum tuberosum]
MQCMPAALTAKDEELVAVSSSYVKYAIEQEYLRAEIDRLKDELAQGNKRECMGSLGKTTIAQKVYHDRQVNVRFQKKVWVSVSQTYDELLIMKGILKQLNADDSGIDKGDLLNRILEALSHKSFLIVLDSVWSIDDGWWDRISRGLPKFVEHNCCIIITSRRKCNTQLEEVGREIVHKCHGLPLAIKTTGGMLSSKPHSLGEWTRICENFREKLVSDSERNISAMASWQLSYDELPAHLKQCMLCFSIYPDDHEIEVEQLVRWWVGEGLISPWRWHRNSTDVAFSHLSELVSRCLVEVVQRRSFDGKVYSCKMHDMVRDMTILVVEDEKFCSFNRGRHIATVNSRHLGENNYSVLIWELKAKSTSSHYNKLHRFQQENCSG